MAEPRLAQTSPVMDDCLVRLVRCPDCLAVLNQFRVIPGYELLDTSPRYECVCGWKESRG